MRHSNKVPVDVLAPCDQNLPRSGAGRILFAPHTRAAWRDRRCPSCARPGTQRSNADSARSSTLLHLRVEPSLQLRVVKVVDGGELFGQRTFFTPVPVP